MRRNRIVCLIEFEIFSVAIVYQFRVTVEEYNLSRRFSTGMKLPITQNFDFFYNLWVLMWFRVLIDDLQLLYTKDELYKVSDEFKKF